MDVALVAVGSESLAAANREQAYVSISRGRDAVRIYTDAKAAMMDAIRRCVSAWRPIRNRSTIHRGRDLALSTNTAKRPELLRKMMATDAPRHEPEVEEAGLDV